MGNTRMAKFNDNGTFLWQNLSALSINHSSSINDHGLPLLVKLVLGFF
jgi:hypothetical protein